jgi:hypothetical protein
MGDPKDAQGNTDREQLRVFVAAALERFAEYHAHKEAMAYAGIAVYGAAAVTVLTTSWPPGAWTWHPNALAVAAFTALWLTMLVYLRFQLRRRRWAALRVAGCDRLLASWLPGAPAQRPRKADSPRGWSRLLARLPDWIWPSANSVPAVDTDDDVYPQEIQTAWKEAQERGTEAIDHERLIHVFGWSLYILVVIRTLAA